MVSGLLQPTSYHNFSDNQTLLFLNNNQNCNMSLENYLKNFMRIKSEKDSFKLGFVAYILIIVQRPKELQISK